MAIDSTFKTPDQLVLADVEKLPIAEVCAQLAEHLNVGIVTLAAGTERENLERWASGSGTPEVAVDVRLRHILAAMRVIHGHGLGDDDVHRWFVASSAFLAEGSALMALKSAQPEDAKVLDEIVAGASTYLQLP